MNNAIRKLHQELHMKTTALAASLAVWCALLGGCMLTQADSEENGGDDVDRTQLETVATNLEIPWSIDFLPDGAVLVAERPGAVKIIEAGAVRTVDRLNVASVGEAGLLGAALDPSFTQNRFVYIYYTYNSQQLYNRLSRFTLTDSLENETILIDLIPASSIHDGGRVRFGPDGFLYATTGDAGVSSRSQDTSNLAGKILRLDTDGSVPADNPFGNFVWALGIRNSQGLSWLDQTLYATDHGPSRHDEINIIFEGGNYGWPQTCDSVDALRCYTDFTLAPAGIVAAQGFLFVTGLRGNQIRRINLETGKETALFTDLGRLRPIALHEGYIYFGTSNRDGRGNPRPDDDRIFRIAVGVLSG